MGFSPGGKGKGKGGKGKGGKGKGGNFREQEDPNTVSLEAAGDFQHPCEDELVCKSTNSRVPYFNANIYLENRTLVGKVEEVLGPINNVYFTVKPAEGMLATSFKVGDKFMINTEKLLPLSRFLAQPKAAKGAGKGAGKGKGGAKGKGKGKGGGKGKGFGKSPGGKGKGK
jgi:H/ACA ribonucleoprotein complex subunit 1